MAPLIEKWYADSLKKNHREEMTPLKPQKWNKREIKWQRSLLVRWLSKSFVLGGAVRDIAFAFSNQENSKVRNK